MDYHLHLNWWRNELAKK